MISRLRMHSRFEAGLSPLYTAPIHTKFGVMSFTCDLTERTVMLGGTAKFGGYDYFHLCPLDIRQVTLREIRPIPKRVKPPPTPVDTMTN